LKLLGRVYLRFINDKLNQVRHQDLSVARI